MNRHPTSPQRPFHPLKPLARTLALLCALGAPTAALAQVAPIPFEAEGSISRIYLYPDGSGVDLTVFGRVMHVPSNAAIHTPTATLTLEQLADPSRFPGLLRDGFVGSTAILIGEVVTEADGTVRPLISDVTVEPAETVLLGTLTKNDVGAMALLDVPLLESTDPRMPSQGYHNDFGFAVQPATIPVGAAVALEGYFGDDGIFHHFLVEASGGELVDPATPQTSVLRARCVAGGRLEVQGASYLPAAALIEFRNPKSGYVFGSMNTTVDLVAPQFGTYRFRVDVNEGEADSDGACPSQVAAVNMTNGSQAISDVDGVVAPPATPPGDPAPANVAPVTVADAADAFVGLATEVHLTLNDTDANGNLDNTTVQLFGVPPGLAVQNLNTGDVLVTAAAAGTYSFSYTVADTGGLVSNPSSVTITAQPVVMDVVDVTRANFRSDKGRWEIRGTTNKAGAQITAVLLRTNETIAEVTADVTGAWQIDQRNSPVRAVAGDIVRVVSSGGGNDQQEVNILR